MIFSGLGNALLPLLIVQCVLFRIEWTLTGRVCPHYACVILYTQYAIFYCHDISVTKMANFVFGRTRKKPKT